MDFMALAQAEPDGPPLRRWIREGNQLYQQGAYREALRHYVLARELFPPLASSLEGNLHRCTQKLLAPCTQPALQLRLPCSPAPVVSILVPVHGQLHTTLACLSAIADHSGQVDLEVLVLDDASDDVTRQTLQQVQGLRLLSQPTNLGFLHTCNAGAREALGRYLLLLNNDTLVQPGWLEALIHTAEASERIGAVGAQLRYTDGLLQEVGGVIWRDGSGWRVGDGESPSPGLLSRPRDVDYCSAAALMVRQDLWEQLGGFDSRYAPAYYEDTDLCFRIREAGYRVVMQPKALVVHFDGASHGRDLHVGVKAHQVLNQKRFRERWADVLEREHQPVGEQPHWALDRAQARAVVLVADHKLPEPDRDAGSRSIMHLMRGLVDAGALVAFWPQNPTLMLSYRAQLTAAGIELLADEERPFNLEQLATWVEMNQPVLDWLLLSRPDVANSVLQAIGPQPTLRLAYYGHDLHHRRLERHAALKPGNTALQQQAAQAKQQEQRIWKQMDLIFYPAADEVDEVQNWLAQQGGQAEVRQLPVFAYTNAELGSLEITTEPPDLPLLMFVAGFAHPPNVESAVWFVQNVWPLLRCKHHGTQLLLVGSHPPATITALASEGITITGAVTDAELERLYKKTRVVIAPIRHGAGVNGKVVEAMHHGVPCVCTPQAARGFSAPGDALRITATPAEFTQACAHLLTSNEAWRKQAEAGLAYVRDHFSAKQLGQALKPLVKPIP